jgi:ATP-binding cassette, subfamily C (CFTR/MRP), member 1
MVDLESGSILIDDIDIDTIGIHTLREKLLVIPQQAPIMGVSIKENIDPKH